MNNLKNLIGAILASSLAAAKSAGNNEVPKQEIIERLRSMGIEAEFVTPEEFHNNTGCSCGNCGNNEPDLSFADALASMLADYDGEDVPQAPTPPAQKVPTPPNGEEVDIRDVFASMFGIGQPAAKSPEQDKAGELELKVMDLQCQLEAKNEEVIKLRKAVVDLQTECGRLYMQLMNK